MSNEYPRTKSKFNYKMKSKLNPSLFLHVGTLSSTQRILFQLSFSFSISFLFKKRQPPLTRLLKGCDIFGWRLALKQVTIQNVVLCKENEGGGRGLRKKNLRFFKMQIGNYLRLKKKKVGKIR
jgi:hypothetical protein